MASPITASITTLLGLVFLVSCGGPTATPDASPSTLAAEAWPTETFQSEAGPAMKPFWESFANGELAENWEEVLTPSFRGEDFSQRELHSTRIQSAVHLGDWKVGESLEAPAFRERWNEYLESFGKILELEKHTWEIQLRPRGDQPGIESKIAVWVLGQLPDGRLREDRLLLVFDLVRFEEESWRLEGVHAEEGRTSSAPGPFFNDVTSIALPPGYDQAGAQIYTDGGPVLADFDGDGDIDLFLPRLHAPVRLYTNDGLGSFEDATAQYGLGTNELATGTNSGLFVDFDGDHHLDLVVGYKQEGLRLFRNEGAFFKDVTGEQPLVPEGVYESIVASDYDGDGDVDLFLANYNLIDVDHQPESYVDARDGLPNVLLENLGDGGFVDSTVKAGMAEDRNRWTYAASWADYDQDGDQDLIVANDYGPNNLYRNVGDGTFEDVAEATGVTDHGNGMGVSWGDLDGDLDLDLYISNMQSFAGHRITRLENFPGTPEMQQLYSRFSKGNSLLANTGDGGFEDHTESSGAKPAFWAWGNVPWDYDCDGDLDLFVSGGFYSGLSAKDT